MPYTEAFTLESQRFTCPITTGLGREVTTDTMFEGYQILKGDYVSSHVISSNYNISHITRKCDFGVCDQVRLKPAYAAPEAS